MRTGRPRTFDRDAALEQAIMVFWKHGYDATPVALLTERLGISTPSLYAAFGNKQDLFLEAVDRYLQTYGAFSQRAVAEEPTAREAVERILREAAATYTGAGHPPGCLVITAATNCSPQSADIAAKLRKIRGRGRRALDAKLTTDVQAGRIPAGTDVHALAGFYSAVVQGMSAQARDGASHTDLELIGRTALAAWPS